MLISIWWLIPAFIAGVGIGALAKKTKVIKTTYYAPRGVLPPDEPTR